MNDPEGYWKSLYPDTIRQGTPGRTWNVGLKETSEYLQVNFDGQIADMPYAGNVGMRVVNTDLNVTQHLTGDPGAYGTEPADVGTQITRRSYRDFLP